MDKVQIIAIIGSICYILLTLPLVFRKRIREEYAILWLLFGGLLLFFSIWREGLHLISKLLGINYPPVTLLLILILSLLLILVQYSVEISKLTQKTIELSQELGITRLELEELKCKLKRKKKKT